MVLCRGLPEQVTDLKIRLGVLLEPILLMIIADKREQLIQQAGARHAVAQPRLIGGQHEQHFVDQQLRIVRVVGAAQAEEQVDLVDAGKVPGVGTAILLPADAIVRTE